MTRLRPARPFPPHGTDGDEPGLIDLGVRLRDALFRRRQVEQVVRPALVDRLTAILSEDDPAQAGQVLQALLDTWPAAALVDGARETWTGGTDGAALAVLARIAEMTALATGSPGGWPEPGEAWIRRTVDTRPITSVERRYPGDGAEVLASMYDVPIVDGPPLDLPAVVRVPAGQLADRVAALAAAMVRGELAAVQILGELPADPLAQLAAFELRVEGPAQDAVTRLGPMGAQVPDAPTWADLVGAAPPGRPGPLLRPLVEVLRLPGTPRSLQEGRVQPTAWLVWQGPFRPLAVTMPAAAVLAQMDGRTGAPEIAARLQAPVGPVEQLIEALLEIGACTAAAYEASDS